MGTRWNATNLLDDELFITTAAIWRKRFAQQREKLHLSQEAFKDLLNESLGATEREDAPRYSQGDVSEWQNIGTKKRGEVAPIRKTLFPRYEVLLHIAQVLGVDVGYLMGETDGETFDEEKTAQYVGLSVETVRLLRMWGEETRGESPLEGGHEEDSVFEMLLGAPGFWELLRCCTGIRAILASEDPFRCGRKALVNKYGLAAIQEACALLEEGREPRFAPDHEPSEGERAWADVKEAMEREARYSDMRYLRFAAARHEAVRAFEELLSEVFPAPSCDLRISEFLQEIQKD